jgi:hypothetical protein
MAHLQFTDVQDRPTEFLDLTSLILDEFQILLPPFEAAFQTHMAAWRLDGKPRTARRFSVYQNCPLPTPEDRLFFLLTDLRLHGHSFLAPVRQQVLEHRASIPFAPHPTFRHWGEESETISRSYWTGVLVAG